VPERLQYGLLLFLVASGLTLIFGIMGVINLAHGSFYMIGAYLAYALAPPVAGTFGGGFFAALARRPGAVGMATCWSGPSSATSTSASTCSRC
jgi:branched-subunit amino acid ABC-type transport system permease component